MISTILVEDEPKSLQLLQKFIQNYCPVLKVVATAIDAKTAYDLILEHQPQLLILDIEISNEASPESSFDLLARLPAYSFEVIFVTAFNHYAIQAIKYHALDYLLKPINIEELEHAVGLAEKRILAKQENDQLFDLIKHLQKPEQKNARLWIPMSDGFQAIEIEDIIRFEAAGRCTYLYLREGQKLLSTRNLKEYTGLLANNEQFLHIHRSHFINTAYIQKYVSTEGGYILMKDQSQIPIARRRKQAFLDQISK